MSLQTEGKKLNSARSKRTTLQVARRISWLYCALIGFILLFLFVLPFQRGALFNGYSYSFEGPLYSFLIWVAIAFMLLSLYFFYHWKFENNRDLFSLFVWLLPCSLFISVLPAAAHHNAVNLAYLGVGYVVFFLMGVYLSVQRSSAVFLQGGIWLSGAVIIIYGLMNLFGNAHAQDAVMMLDDQLRLTSVFQYANTYAAYLTGFILSSVWLTGLFRKWYSVALPAFFLVPGALSFLLTLSRAGYLIFALLVLIVILCLPLYRQILFLLHMSAAFLGALVITNRLTAAGLNLRGHFDWKLSMSSWLILLLASITVGAVVLVTQLFVAPQLDRWMSRFNLLPWVRAWIPAAALLLGAVMMLLILGHTWVSEMLPTQLRLRFEAINLQQNSLLERFAFYRDSLHIWLDYPIFGAGGGAWAALYEYYQGNPYTSTQTHSYFLQYLIETGVFGVIILIAFLGAAFWIYAVRVWRQAPGRDTHAVFFLTAIAILIHSSIDFNMSYAYIASLVFFCLGGLVSMAGSACRVDAVKARFAAVWNFRPKSKWLLRKAFPIALFLLSILLFALLMQRLNSNTAFVDTLGMEQQTTETYQLLPYIDAALNTDSTNPEYVLWKINLLTRTFDDTKDKRYLDRAQFLIDGFKHNEPYNHPIFDAQFNIYLKHGQLLEALTQINLGIARFPWDIREYERAMALQFELGDQTTVQADRDRFWDGAISLYRVIRDKASQLALLPKGQNQGRPFGLTPNIALPLGKIDFKRGNYPAAIEMLLAGMGNPPNLGRYPLEEQTNRELARWYLASLSKVNRNNEALYQRLIKKDPQEADYIAALVKGK